MLTGCRKGAVPRAPRRRARRGARARRLVAAFGRDRVLVELWDHGDPLDRHRNDALAESPPARVSRWSPPTTSTTRRPRSARSPPLAAIRARRSLDEIDGWLPRRRSRTCAARPSRPAASRAGPGASAPSTSRRRARSTCASPRPTCPTSRCPPATPTCRGCASSPCAARRSGTRRRTEHEQAMRQIEHELGVIEQLGFPGYFLLLVDIVEFCKAHDIYCQGGGARRTARSATRSVSPRPTRSSSACCSSGSCHPSATARPTSTSTSSTSVARR